MKKKAEVGAGHEMAVMVLSWAERRRLSLYEEDEEGEEGVDED